MNGATPASRAAIEKGKEIFDELTSLFGFVKEENDDDALIKEIEAAIEARMAAKKAKNYARADEIRKYLADKGITLVDSSAGTTYKLS